MTKIVVTDRQGKVIELTAELGMSLMEIIRDAGMDIEAACGGCCACATCHIYVENEWVPKLIKADEDEESMLDQAFDVRNTSRLSCQISLSDELDGIELEIAKE